jgi:chlorophyllide a reductase subunit Y
VLPRSPSPSDYDTVVITNLCVPTGLGACRRRLLPKEINGVRVVGIDVPGFGVPTHAEAKDVLAGAMLKYARLEAEQGPVQGASQAAAGRPTVTLVGEMFPADPVGIGRLLEPMGLAAGPRRADARMARALRRASTACRWPRSIPSIQRLSANSRRPGGRSSARLPGGRRGNRLPGCRPSGTACGLAPSRDRPLAQNAMLPAIRGALSASPIKGRITLSGYEGSELLVASAAGRERGGPALCRHRLPREAASSEADRDLARGGMA